MSLYWQLGEYISEKIASAEWGEGVVDELAATIARAFPGARGFTRRNLFRMRQFYDAYRGQKKVSPLLTQLPWTHHLIILGQSKSADEREFYMLAAIKGRWTSRELERQLRTQAFRRKTLGAEKVSAALAQTHPSALDEFKNAYSLEFLGLAYDHSEADLHGALLRNLGRFIARARSRFLLRGLRVPGAGREPGLRDRSRLLSPRSLLPRRVKKAHERPSIGVLLCATKDDEVVEYALARTSSPTLVAEYQTLLPSKALLRRKLHELYAQLAPPDDGSAQRKRRTASPSKRDAPRRRGRPS